MGYYYSSSLPFGRKKKEERERRTLGRGLYLPYNDAGFFFGKFDGLQAGFRRASNHPPSFGPAVRQQSFKIYVSL